MLPEKDIPTEIWFNNMLHLPSCLSAAYWNLLEKYKITKDALSTEDPGTAIIGGSGREETLEHFAKRYGVSTCRVSSLIIDPDSAFSAIPDDIISTFAEGRISILDIACGAGAVGASLLSTFSALRLYNKLPKLPLDVRIVGGDCSVSALDIYTDMLQQLEPTLKSVGINTTLITKQWQAEQSYTTSEMFDILFEGNPSTEEYLIVIANFAGTLNAHFSDFKDTLNQMFDRSGNKKCTIIWVESQMNSAFQLFEKIKNFINKHNPWYKSSQEDPISSEYDWFHPFLKSRMVCRVLVKEYKRS